MASNANLSVSELRSRGLDELMDQQLANRMHVNNPSTDFQELIDKANDRGKAPEIKPIEQMESSNSYPSPIDTYRNSYRVDAISRGNSPLALENIQEKNKDNLSKISDLKNSLSESDLQVRNSTKGLLTKRLSNVSQNLQQALQRAGADNNIPLGNPYNIGNPIRGFLDTLINSEKGMKDLGVLMQGMADNADTLSLPGMMAIQIKVNTISREIELFTSLLSKAIEGTKTIMNVQV